MDMLVIEPQFFIFCAVLVMVLPLPWLLSAIFAAMIHEFWHIAAVLVMGGRITKVRVAAGGAQIEAHLAGKAAQAVAVLAGPVGSLMLLFLCHAVPGIALCGLAQGVYNLLPLPSLDGGRALRLFLSGICPGKAEIICTGAEILCTSLLLAAAFWYMKALSLGFWPIMAALVPVSGLFRRKIPCKRRKIGVQ